MPQPTEIGKVLYFDPNNSTVDSNIPSQLMQNPEDLCIGVDLMVTIKNQETITSGNQKVSYNLIGPNTKINFLEGGNLGGASVLTDFFANIGDKTDDSENISEAMCVSSIDVEFSSWYAASVIINFTDVRGAALMTEADYADNLKEGNPAVSVQNRSLFKSFFDFPYPMYVLKIKGFYGDAVSYPLHCSDFKANFNATTGNFDIIVSFIGYTYAMLNDVQISYLMAAPYCIFQGAGSAYWDAQVLNGRFKTSDGQNLPKIVELMKKVKDGDYQINKISQNTLSTGLQDKINERNILDDIKNNYMIPYLSAVKSTYKSGIYDSNNTLDLININSKDPNLIDGTPVAELKTLRDSLFNKITDYEGSYLNSVVFDSINTDGDSSILNPQATNDGNTTTYEVIFSTIGDAMIDLTTSLNTAIANLSTTLDNEKNNTLTVAYQMKPNIFNYFKVLVAHMETFYDLIYTCNKSIPSDRPFESSMKINSTDYNVTKTKNGQPILPPFPWYSQLGKDGKMEDAWIGSVAPNLAEVELVNALTIAKTNVQKELDKIKVSAETPEPTSIDKNATVTIGDVYYPMNAFDNTINLIGGKTESPYKNLPKDVDSIYDRLFLRTYIPNLLSGASTLPSYNQDFALAESRNIFEDVGDNTINLAQVQNQIRTLENPSIESKRNFTSTFNYNLTHNELNISHFLPLFEDIEVNYNSYKKQTDLLESRKKHWVSFDPDYNSSIYKKQINFVVVEGTENANKITNDYYIKLINNIKNSGQVFNKIMSHYYFLDDKNDPVSYKYIGGDISNIDIFNRICETKRCPIDDIKNKKNAANSNAFFAYDKAKIDIKYIYQENINLDTIFHLYLPTGVTQLKPNDEVFKNYQKSKDLSIPNNYSYPFIGGYYYGLPFSLFGHPFYYNQNAPLNSNAKTLQVSDFHKAILFLNSLNVNTKEVETLFLDNKNISSYNENNYLNRPSFMARIPKVAILLIGATLWRFRYDNLYPFLTYGDTKLPNLLQYFKVNGLFTIKNTYNFTFSLSSVSDTAIYGESVAPSDYDTCNLFFKKSNENYQSIFNSIEEDSIIEEFTDWAIMEWPIIRDQFELKIKTNNTYTNNTVISADYLKDLINNTLTDTFLKNVINNINSYINISTTNITNTGILPKSVVNSLILINKDDTVGVKTIINLLLTDCVIAYSGNSQNSDATKVSTMQSSMLAQINNNLGSLKNPTVQAALGISKPNPNKNIVGSVDYNPDMNLAVYAYLKTINDKWVSGFSSQDEYKWITTSKGVTTDASQFKALPLDVDYYIRNFRFIDRAHNDIGVDMLVNYRELFELIDAATTQKTLFSAMTDVLQQNQMLFLPMPSYQSFDSAADFSKIFKPIPFVESKLMNHDPDYDTSMYLCMYAGRPSSKLDHGKEGRFANDGYPLNNPIELPNDYKTINTTNAEQQKVPAIAVNFGQQNQQYFKNIGVNMSNPNTTDASIRILQNLNDRANQNATVEPIGQDLFSLYSQYSYSCEVEMMGCAQVQPMMYFQLNNLPMWNGAYMIFKIKHMIKPGTMTTTFTGMRMAKTYPKLISQNAVTFKLLGNLENYSDIIPPVEGTDNIKYKDITAPENSKLQFASGNHFFVKDYFVGDGWTGKFVTDKIYNRVSYLSQVIEKIYSEWINLGESKLSFGINSGYRDHLIYNDKGSAHTMGLAADIQITTDKSKETQNSLFSFIITMMSQGLPVDELILETYTEKTYYMHIGLATQTNPNEITSSPNITNGRYNSRGLVETHDAITDGKHYPKLGNPIMEAMWPQTGDQSVKNTKTPASTQSVQLYVKTALKNSNLNPFQAAGVMGNMYQESTFNLNANPQGAAHNMYYGLIQWSLSSYGSGGTYENLKTTIGTTKELQMAYLFNHTTGYTDFVNSSQSVTTPEQASLLFSNKVEICLGSCVNSNRDAFSRSFYQRFNDPNDYLYWG